MTTLTSRRSSLQLALRIEWFSVAWMIVEAIVSIAAGLFARSLLLTAFGLDSVIELITATTLLWRLKVEARGADTERVEAAERCAQWVTAIALVLLVLYVLATAVADLFGVTPSEGSAVGIGISLAAVVIMPWLAWTKRRQATELESDALRNDAASSLTCAYMAGTVLVGVVFTTVFKWWWAEGVAALVFLVWLAGETREAIEEAREGVQDE